MTYIYAPEQKVVWFQTKKGGMKTIAKHRATFVQCAGLSRATIVIDATGERKTVNLDALVSLSQFKGSPNDLR